VASRAAPPSVNGSPHELLAEVAVSLEAETFVGAEATVEGY
jgi:hypothetical protein